MVKYDYDKPKKHLGHPYKFNRKDHCSIRTHISIIKKTKTKITARKWLNNLHFDISIRTMHRALTDKGFGFSKARKCIVLKTDHKTEECECFKLDRRSNLLESGIMYRASHSLLQFCN